MNTYYQPGSPYRPGSPAPQRVFAAGGSAAGTAIPQVDHHHPYPTYQPGPAAWSEVAPQQLASAPPGYRANPTTGYPATGYPDTGYSDTGYPATGYSSTSYPLTRYQPAVWTPDFSQPYQPPTWTTAEARRTGTRNTLAVVIVGLALLLVAGAVTVIVTLGRTASASPATPREPSVLVPATSGPTSSVPTQPRPFPAQPGAHVGDGTSAAPTTAPVDPTTAPVDPTTGPADPRTAPAEPTTQPAQPTTEPAEPTTNPTTATDGPGLQEAERAAEGFVEALRSSDFDRAAGYICSDQAATFAAGAPSLAGQVQLTTVELEDVRVTGARATMTMSYQPVAQVATVSESLQMTVEDDAWKICS